MMIRGNFYGKSKICFCRRKRGDEFFVLEETMINGSQYILVTDSDEDDAECLILKETGRKGEETASTRSLKTRLNFWQFQRCSKNCWRM